MKVACKHCGSEYIVECNVMLASCPVTTWEMRDGVPMPDDYAEADMHWDTMKVVDDGAPYFCRGCDRELLQEELVACPEEQTDEQP